MYKAFIFPAFSTRSGSCLSSIVDRFLAPIIRILNKKHLPLFGLSIALFGSQALMAEQKMPVISVVSQVTLSVIDLDRAQRFYELAFGYEMKGSMKFSATDSQLADAWRLPADVTGELRVLGPSASDVGLIRLVSFSIRGESVWGDYNTPEDLGYYAINMRVDDISNATTAITSSGGVSRSGPHFWEVMQGVSAHDSTFFDPEGNLLDVFELTGDQVEPIFGKLEQRSSALQTVALHTSNADLSKRFYTGLGFQALYDKKLSGLEDLLKLPKGVVLRNMNMIKQDVSPLGRVEITQYIGMQGRSPRDRALPPNLGILMMSFQTDDLASTEALILELGGSTIGGTAELFLPTVGRVKLQTFFGPDDEVIEFYQALE